jgi:hypothetical protein
MTWCLSAVTISDGNLDNGWLLPTRHSLDGEYISAQVVPYSIDNAHKEFDAAENCGAIPLAQIPPAPVKEY